jgi:acyl-CoA thioester hydrolase
MLTHEARLRVRYAETDQMGVVYHANYLVWMEVGRVEYCRAAGVRYRDMEREAGEVGSGGRLPLSDAGPV